MKIYSSIALCKNGLVKRLHMSEVAKLRLSTYYKVIGICKTCEANKKMACGIKPFKSTNIMKK